MSRAEVLAWLGEMERLGLEEQMLATAAANPSESYIKSLTRKLQARRGGTTAQDEALHRSNKAQALIMGHAIKVTDSAAYVAEMKAKWEGRKSNANRH